jgi:hypothetical protein
VENPEAHNGHNNLLKGERLEDSCFRLQNLLEAMAVKNWGAGIGIGKD